MTTEMNRELNQLGDLESRPAAGQPFNWLKQWYPVSPLSYLDGSCPTPITLLGKKLVVWQHEGQWTVMDDVCPHKLTQLSLGKIQPDGTLVCRQHGWGFDRSGQCVKIPMLADPAAQAAAYRNARSYVTTYPTQVEQGLLWVWTDDSPTAWEECQQKQPATLPDPIAQWAEVDWHMVEVPVGYTVSVESSFDPSHAQFLHEGIGSFSPATAIPMRDFERVGELSVEGGFVLRHRGYNTFNQDMEATRSFRPPCANTTKYHLPTGGVQIAQLYFVPTAPGYCRYIAKFVMDATPPVPHFNLVQRVTSLLWGLLPQDLQVGLKHLGTYKLGDQDITVMRAQEQIEAAADRDRPRTPFFPSPADQGILTWRAWLKRFAGGGPAFNTPYSEGLETISHEQLYDRWHRHSKLCPSCRGAVEWITNVQRVCQRLAIVAVVLGAIMLLLPLPLQVSLGCLAIAILSLLGHEGLAQLRSRFMSSIPPQGDPRVKLYDE